jgi:hypothetical protein
MRSLFCVPPSRSEFLGTFIIRPPFI